jgi:hypothetical protein
MDDFTHAGEKKSNQSEYKESGTRRHAMPQKRASITKQGVDGLDIRVVEQKETSDEDLLGL